MPKNQNEWLAKIRTCPNFGIGNHLRLKRLPRFLAPNFMGNDLLQN